MVLLQQLKQGMQVIPGYSNSVKCSKQINNPRGLAYTDTMHKTSLFSKPMSKGKKILIARKKHSEGEKRRRDRINGHFETLRAILPNFVKTDKASVLAETLKRVTGLKNTVKELKDDSGGRMKCLLPSEEDKLSLGYCEGDGGLMKITFSCEDRPGLISELTRALRSVKGRVVRAEMVTVGGRTKWVLWVQGLNGNEGIGMIKRALKVVVEPILQGNNKRQLWFTKDTQ